MVVGVEMEALATAYSPPPRVLSPTCLIRVHTCADGGACMQAGTPWSSSMCAVPASEEQQQAAVGAAAADKQQQEEEEGAAAAGG